MALDELRVTIAERLGYSYFWHDGLYACYMHHRTASVTATELSGRPDPDKTTVNMNGVPDWPADIAAAASLLQDADRRGWYVVLDNDAGYEGDAGAPTVWNCCMAGECCLESKTLAEAVSRAWLKAMEAQE